MGNEIQKEYNIKSKPLKLPGAYNFLKFFHHPTQNLSLLLIKYPHQATSIQSNVILAIKQIKNLSNSNDLIAICPKCIPLSLVKPKGQTQMKILMYKILKIGSQIGRCFLSSGRIHVWCQEKRGLSSMAPQQLQHGKISQKSKVFTTGVTLLNFLFCVNQNKIFISDKESKKKKKKQENKNKNNQSFKQITINKTSTLQNEALPESIKLFFDPKDQKQYYQILQTLQNKLSISSFWTQISEVLRQLIMNMLSLDPNNRVNLETILKIPYFQQSSQIKLYFTLTDDLQYMQIKEAFAFLKSLQLIIKQGAVFENQILEDYIVPILVSIAIQKKPQSINLASKALSILIEVNKPPIQLIFNVLKKSTGNDKNMILLAIQKKQKLFYLFDENKFDSALSKMLFYCYENQDLLNIAVISTPFIMSSIKDEKYKKQIQFKLINRVLNLPHEKNTEKLFLNGLKCGIQLLKKNMISNVSKYLELKFQPLKLSLQANIHVLYFYGLLTNYIPTKNLISTMIPKLDIYLSQNEISNQLFTTAHSLTRKIMLKLYQQRKLKSQDDINLQYSSSYFALKDEFSAQNKQISDEILKVKTFIEKNQLKKLQWIFKEIL